MPDNLIALAEKVEAAAGPDRDLDAAIKAAVGHAWDYAADWGPRGHDKPVAFAYTASLDAALTLVPEGLEWELLAYDAQRDPRFGRFQCRIMLLRFGEDPDETGPQAIANGHTPALALTAASLRARAAMLPSKETNDG